MKILITGVDSFIGKNLRLELLNRGYTNINGINYTNCEDNLLKLYIDDCDFIFHLETLYRSETASDFYKVNTELTKKIIDIVGESKKSLLLLSSIKAGDKSDYGESKLQAEEIIKTWAIATRNKAFIFRLANEFGKWCPPNFNSVVATFCNNIASNKDIIINNSNDPLKLMYIDDINDHFISKLDNPNSSIYSEVEPSYDSNVGEVAKILKTFKSMRDKNTVPDLGNELTKKLYSTYLSYLPDDKFQIPSFTNVDERGSFTELLHFENNGQVSINISKPGVTKGNHWHHSKNEKFIVISGIGIIKLRKIGDVKIIEYQVDDAKIEAIDIPPGYTHNITNTGERDMLTIMWANEIFDKSNPDTYFEEV